MPRTSRKPTHPAPPRWRGRAPSCAGTAATLLAALLLAATLAAPPTAAETGGNLLVLPHRVVFEGRDRTAEISLLNQGTAPALYRISFVDLRMTGAGGFEEIETFRLGERPAADLIRYAPRQVRLGPGAAQTVRLMVRKPSDLAAGEYRSHLLFRLVPPADAGESVEPPADGALGVRLTPVFNLRVPVIVRHGDLGTSVRVEEIELRREDDGDAPALSVLLARQGAASTYGDVTVTHRAGDGTETQLAYQRGLAVYTPDRTRRLEIPIHPPEDLDLDSGTLRFTYSARDERPGRRRAPRRRGADATAAGPVLAETEIALP